MNLMHSEFLIVLFVIMEAINGLTPYNLSTKSHTQDLPALHAVTEKSQLESNVSEAVKIIVPTPANSTTSTTSTPNPVITLPQKPESTSWIIRNTTTDVICIIAEMTMQLNITYPVKNKLQQNAILNIPKNATATGNCSDQSQYMIIRWESGHSLMFNFSVNETTKNYFVSQLNLTINAKVFKDVKVDDNFYWNFVNNNSEFITPMNMSYKCIKVQNFNLENDDNKLKAVLSINNTQLQAYVNGKTPNFGAAQDCDAFDTPDIVPIAVGCALAILVLVVLVAYLIGRKRSQNRGYLSM